MGSLGRSLTYRMSDATAARAALARLRDGFALTRGTLGFGEPTLRALGHELAGLRTFPALSGSGTSVPSTQEALWIMLRDDFCPPRTGEQLDLRKVGL